MSERRVIRLLNSVELTPRQMAQRRYRRKAKGRAANQRAFAKWLAKPENRAHNIARVRKWAQENQARCRVYKRIYKRSTYQPHGLPAGTGQLQYTRQCDCGKVVRGNAFTNHVRACRAAKVAA